ncbi:MAG: GDSL-type esterase/lipase family protein [Bacteroidota bacterium]
MFGGCLYRHFLILFFLLASTFGLAQPHPAPSSPLYPFVRYDLNLIVNNYRGLRNFYHQIDMMREGTSRTVTVVHIGDSHIQADWFPGTLRQSLQEEFGSAGRGLVFPYQLAHTNGPNDVHAFSNVKWRSRRNVQNQTLLPIGVSGITLQTTASHFLIKLSVGDNMRGGIDYRFNKVTLFTGAGPNMFDVRVSPEYAVPISTPAVHIPSSISGSEVKEVHHLVESGETLEGIARQYKISVRSLKEINHLQGSLIFAGQKLLVRRSKVLQEPEVTPIPQHLVGNDGMALSLSQPGSSFANTVYLEGATNTLFLRGSKSQLTQNQLTLFGMVLENTQHPGILYHTIGVNGAKFKSYTGSTHFLEQLQVLQPDLIVVSLGTNESVNQYFSERTFYQHLDDFVHKIEQYLPHTDILLTTPPDAFRARQYSNPNVLKAKETLYNYTLSNDLACWDFYGIMGGLDSIEKWYQSGLAQRDKLHLTRAGYELQGHLLFDALMNGYGSFRSAK